MKTKTDEIVEALNKKWLEDPEADIQEYFREAIRLTAKEIIIAEFNVRIADRSTSKDGWDLGEREVAQDELTMFQEKLRKKWLGEGEKK